MDPDKTTITAALEKVLQKSDAEAIADVLCATPAQVTVVDDEAGTACDDGTLQYHEKTPAERLVDDVFRSTPMMVHLPARLFHAPCFSNRLRERLGRVMANHVAATFTGPRNEPVRETIILAMSLEYAYGRDGLVQRIDSCIFNKPEYAAAMADARPLAIRCTNAN